MRSRSFVTFLPLLKNLDYNTVYTSICFTPIVTELVVVSLLLKIGAEIKMHDTHQC